MSDQVPLAFLGGSPGPGELLLLFLAVLVLFGPRRLPEMARKAGKIFENLRRASQDFRDQVMQIENEPPKKLPQAPESGPATVAPAEQDVQPGPKPDLTASQAPENKDKKEDDPNDALAG